jgi:hypothetical protein
VFIDQPSVATKNNINNDNKHTNNNNSIRQFTKLRPHSTKTPQTSLFNQLHKKGRKHKTVHFRNHYIQFCLFDARFLNFPPLLIAGVIISDSKNSNVIFASVHLSTGVGMRSKAYSHYRK